MDLANYVLLIGKSYIWVSRRKDKKPAIAHLKQILNNKYDRKIYVAQKKTKNYQHFVKKWDSYQKNILNPLY